MVSRRAVLAAVISATAPGCTLLTDSFLSNNFSGDAYPINVDTHTGAILVQMRPTGGTETTAVLDLLSPLTTTDPADPNATPDLVTTNIGMFGLITPSAPTAPEAISSTNSVERAEFVGAQLISLHACDAKGACTIGSDDPKVQPPVPVPPTMQSTPAVSSFQSVLGADSLAGDAIRLRLTDSQIFVLPDIGGSDHQRSLDCDAVFDSPYRGGGTLVIAGTETAFGNRRIALATCLGPHPEAALQANRGTDALFVVSTAIGISIIGNSAYQRYLLTHPPTTAADTTDHTVYLPSGIVHGQLGFIESIALVAPQAGNALAPCRQIYAHRVLSLPPVSTKLCDGNPGDADCPCEDGTTSCNVPAILELNPAPAAPAPAPPQIQVLVVDDDDPTLQALRTELRPDQPEVDGILGTNALTFGEFDADYPHDRLLARCAGGACCTRPELVDTTDEQLAQIQRCIKAQPTCQTTPVAPP
jgi:hypothetical protein